ncbi:TPA: hypothetical protein DEP96_00760 [Candidatus Uhrbacteria bacterium]|nr:hypothetical protein [Candidatus Uhrbacteria bacterium]
MNFPRGTTYVELILAVAILLVIFTFGGFALAKFQRSTAVIAGDREIINAISMAARRARNGAAGTAWGVYLPYNDSTRSATNLTVFSGNTYATRTASRDLTFSVTPSILFASVDFSGSSADVTNSHEIVFAPLTGTTAQYGSMTLTWFGTSRTIVINSNGVPTRQ